MVVLEVWEKNKPAWGVLIGSFMGYVSYLMNQCSQKWSFLPVLVSVAQTQSPIWEIPFPAITICSETKINHANYSFSSLYHKSLKEILSEKEARMYGIFSLVCDNKVMQYTEGNETIEEEDIQFLIDSNPPLPRLCYDFYWDAMRFGSCKSQLTPILTDEGVCYSFNLLDRDEIFKADVVHFGDFGRNGLNATKWSLEQGYPDEDFEDSYPKRTAFTGTTSGVATILGIYERNLDYLCKVPVRGIKMVLHPPDEIPRPRSKYIRIPMDQEVLISVKPQVVKTSERLKSFAPEDRQCYFQGERDLAFFRIYSQRNCEFECFVNATLDLCGCAAYFMPRKNSTPICGPASSDCIRRAQRKMMVLQSSSQESLTNSSATANSSETAQEATYRGCKCLQGCHTIKYDVQTSLAKFEWIEYFRALENKNRSKMERLGIRFSKVNIFFDDLHFTALLRNELYNNVDFIASSGGIMAFFTGFSIFTFIEVGFDAADKVKNAKKDDGGQGSSGGDQSGGDQPGGGDQPAGDQPSAEQPAAEQPAAPEQPAPEQPSAPEADEPFSPEEAFEVAQKVKEGIDNMKEEDPKEGKTEGAEGGEEEPPEDEETTTDKAFDVAGNLKDLISGVQEASVASVVEAGFNLAKRFKGALKSKPKPKPADPEEGSPTENSTTGSTEHLQDVP